MRAAIAVLAAVTVFVSIRSRVEAQSTQSGAGKGQEALQALQARPRVTVSITQRNVTVTGALDVYVELTNLTQNDFTILRVELELPGEVVAARGTVDVAKPQDVGRLMNPGHVRAVTFRIPSQPVGYIRAITNADLLTFVPGDYSFRAVVTYDVPPQQGITVSETATVRLEPPLLSLIWGGAMGAALLALFIGTYRMVRQRPSRRLLELVLETTALAAAGVVCAVIALILLRRLQGVDLPVNLTVTDFYGGVVVGLFSFKIGDWLYAKLFGESPSSAGAPPRQPAATEAPNPS